MGLARRIFCLASAFVVFFLSMPVMRASGPWDDAASEFAEQIVARVGRNAAITLEVKNRSGLSADDVAEVDHALRAQLRSHGVRVLVTKRPVPDVAGTLSENAQGLLWIAEIRRGDAEDVVMVQAPRPPRETSPASPETLVIRKTLVFEQPKPILDLAEIAAPEATEPWLLVLDTEEVALYKKQETGWVVQQALPLKRARPWPRDPRGRLVVREGGAFDAFTPGMECQGTTAPALTLDCVESEAGWPVVSSAPAATVAHFVSDRNYFDGKMKTADEETQVPEFFTSASLVAPHAKFRIFANLDGRARMFGKGPQPAAIFDGWGSDLTAIQSGCAEGFQVLATRSGDLSQPDSLQAFSIRGGEAVQAGAPVEFRGPVTALWPAQNGAAALAVELDLTTGMYDAFSISISCSR
jgi:hypothetical protein